MRRASGWVLFIVGIALGLASLALPSSNASFIEDTLLLGQSWFPFVVGAAGISLMVTGWAWAHDRKL